MEKRANPRATNTRTTIPFIGDINNRRFVTTVLAGILGGAGTSAAANLLRRFRELRKTDSDETDENTIVLTLPKQASGYDSMASAKPGEYKITAKGGRQFRADGKYSTSVGEKAKPKDKEAVKCAEGNPGPNTVGTIVANTIGFTAGGLISYDIVSRIFDKMNERRLKRKLEAAQQAYVSALSGQSKRAAAVLKILTPVEHVICKGTEKKADALDLVRYPAAAYILALLAGTGATAYMTKKVMDREFPEEKLKKDVNKPTRIIFRTVDTNPSLLEGTEGNEKQASVETCATIAALMPVYMDIVEGAPNRTLSAPYVKLAEEAGTDPAGLMKLAATDLSAARTLLLKNPKTLFSVLFSPDFFKNMSKLQFARVLKAKNPELYKNIVDSAIDSNFATGEGAGVMKKLWNNVAKFSTKAFANMGGRDMLVENALSPKHAEAKQAGSDSLLRSGFILSSVFPDKGESEAAVVVDPESPEAVLRKSKRALKRRRSLSVAAADAHAAKYISEHKGAISNLIKRLNARGSI